MSTNDHEMEGLTEAEIAALAEPDGDVNATQGELEDKAKANEQANGAKNATEPAAKADGSAGDGAAATPGDDGAATGAAPAAEAAAPAAAEPSAAPSQPAQQAPILVAQAPADAEAKLQKISEDKAALRQKYDDGEITFADYENQKDALDEQRMEIKLAVKEAQTAEKIESQRHQNQWVADCTSFMDKYKATYDGEANVGAMQDLDAAIKTIAAMPSSANLSGPQILERAHSIVMATRGTPVAAAAAAPAAKPAAAPKPALPPDLGAVPAASSNDPGEGKWASLDRLMSENPAAYEAALAKMPEAEREAYLAT